MSNKIEIKPGLTITREQQLELRRAGIAALRSGEFKQYWGALENRGCNCPMGVLCRVFDRMFPGILEIKVEPLSSDTSFDGRAGNIPKVVQLAFGFRTIRGSYGANRSITMDNDCLLMMDDISRWAVEDLLYIEFIKGMTKGMEVATKCIFKHGSDPLLMKHLIDENERKLAALKDEHHRRFNTSDGIAATREQWRDALRNRDKGAAK